jgi:hypothetical protein
MMQWKITAASNCGIWILMRLVPFRNGHRISVKSLTMNMILPRLGMRDEGMPFILNK